MPRREWQPCCCVHMTAATRAQSPPFQVIFGHWSRSDSSPLQWTALQCILVFKGAKRGTARAWLDILQNHIEQSRQSGFRNVSNKQRSVVCLSSPVPVTTFTHSPVHMHVRMSACTPLLVFTVHICHQIVQTCFLWDRAHPLLLSHGNIKSETQLHETGGQRRLGYQGTRALLVFKSLLGMGVWKAPNAQKKERKSTLNIPQKFHQALVVFLRGYFMLLNMADGNNTCVQVCCWRAAWVCVLAHPSPSCLQATAASSSPHPSLQTEPHAPPR